MVDATALIAEDEPLLAAELERALAAAWPALRVVARAEHGAAAVEAALRVRPDVVFLDIRMPGMSGLEPAQALAEDWPDDAPPPFVVFVTAYERHAMEAFEHAAVDYLLKPVDDARLARTVARLQALLRERRHADASAASSPTEHAAPTASTSRAALGEPGASVVPDGALAAWQRFLATPDALRALAPAGPPAARLEVIQAGSGSAVHLVPVNDVVYFEAADKYVRVLTADREHLIRLALRELVPQLDPQRFWQVHRGTVVRADAIARAERDDAGKVTLVLRDRPERLAVSRLYAHRFRPM